MITIHKQVLKLAQIQSIYVPLNSEFLCTKMQYGDICLWYKCNTDEKYVHVDIDIFGTGTEIENNEDLVYIDTVISNEGSFVWHIFRRK